MLSIAKLRVGQEAYHLSGVAQSLDDYYTGAGEANGVWVGGSATRLGLDGQVDAGDLQAVLAGLRPGAGGLSPNGDRHRPHPRRAPGFDLTFKAPKSASVLYAVSDDPRVQGAIIESGEAAMRAAVGWIEREVIRVRRGSHNEAWLAKHRKEPGAGPRSLPSNGVVAAAFRHRTSRAGDPLLHWHVLVANLVEGVDGKWSAFVHPDLFRNMRAAGEVFQAVYRSELSHRLGVEWRPGRHVPEIAGVPQSLLDQFSKRSDDIEAWLAATGTPDTREGRQAAVLATRRHKAELESSSCRFDEAWKTEAAEFGWGADRADGLIEAAGASVADDEYEGAWRLDDERVDDGQVTRIERLVDPEEWIERVLREDLTAQHSTFTRADLTVAIAARQGPGATAATIERVAHRFLASEQLIPVATDDDIDRWTSRELFTVERRFAATVASNQALAVVPAACADKAFAARPSLGDDQLASVRTIAASTAPVAVLVGPAGTGKTFTVDTIRAAYQHAGWLVHGAAPSARAALELAAGANLRASTLHALLATWNRGLDLPAPNSLLVIDEAGMAAIRTLESVITRQVTAGGQVLLVGDHHQLPEIGAGGGLEHAVGHSRCVTELTVNRRQQHAWEQRALTDLRDGHVAAAVHTYLGHDRVVVAESPAAMVATAVQHWLDARYRGLHPVLLAGTNDLVDRLNAAVIERLIERGELTAESAPFGNGDYRTGQRIVLRRNSSSERTTTGGTTAVANGQAGVVVTADDQRVVLRLDHGAEVVLDHTYLRRGGDVAHAYALTTHRAQGGTWDTAIAVGADGLYREGAYVALSRGAEENVLVLTEPEIAELERQAAAELARHDTGITPPDELQGDLEDDLTERLTRSRAKHLARTVDPDAAAVERLAQHLSYPQLIERHHAAAAAELRATELVGAERHALAAERERIDRVAHHLSIGLDVSPHDRHNIGTVAAIDDNSGTATVHFTSRQGYEATRTFSWAQLRIIDQNPPERDLTPSAVRQLARLTGPLHRQIDQWDQTIRTIGFEPGDALRLTRAINIRINRATAFLVAERTDWIEHYLGRQVADPAGSTTWLDGARSIATWRLEKELATGDPGIGRRPHDAGEWDQLNEQLARTRQWLDTTDRLAPAWPVVPSHDELVDRLDQLTDILHSAPDDCRHFIAELQSGQLTIQDTSELLEAALAQQDQRRTWIIEHWPHIVEHQEIIRTLDDGFWGPDPSLLQDLLDWEITDNLAEAVHRGDRWLRALLCKIANPDTSQLDADQVDVFEEVAGWRAVNDVSALESIPEPMPGSREIAEVVAARIHAALGTGGRPEVQSGVNPAL
jgi:conjugative relaxase-like TrwC/TraI family protein